MLRRAYTRRPNLINIQEFDVSFRNVYLKDNDTIVLNKKQVLDRYNFRLIDILDENVVELKINPKALKFSTHSVYHIYEYDDKVEFKFEKEFNYYISDLTSSLTVSWLERFVNIYVTDTHVYIDNGRSTFCRSLECKFMQTCPVNDIASGNVEFRIKKGLRKFLRNDFSKIRFLKNFIEIKLEDLV